MTYRTKKKVASILRGITIFAVCIGVLFPFLWMVRVSFLNKVDIFDPLNFNAVMTLENYRSIIESGIGKYFTNSLIVAILTTLISLILGSFAAYGFARYNWKKREDRAFWVLSQKFLPAMAVVIPYFTMAAAFRLLDTQLLLVICYTTFNICFNFGAAFSSGVQTSILSSAGAFSGILISALIFKEDALTARKIGGCVLGVVAVVILNWPDICAGVTTSLFGALLLLLGQVSGSFGAAYMKLVSRGRSAIWVGSWQSLISGVLLIIAGLAGKAPLSFRGAGAPLVPPLVLVVTSGAALIFSSQLYKYNPLSKIMIFSLLSPVFGVFSSAIMLGDPLNSGYVVVSLLLNCLGVALVTTEKPAA